MAKSVLNYVQACLSVMDSDEVDSINDTTESFQIAALLQDVYYELMNRQDWDFLYSSVPLLGQGDLDVPVRIGVDGDVRHLDNVWYDVGIDGEPDIKEMVYVPAAEFLSCRIGKQAQNDVLILQDRIRFYCHTNAMPTCYTTFNDNSIWFDGFDENIESSLTSDKCSAMGVVIPQFAVIDDFVPAVPTYVEPLLQATLNASASIHFKQQRSIPDERREQRQLSQLRLKHGKIMTDELDYYTVSYGRPV